ncbi:MAG TPA: cysteine hydrolase, partial [Burkholderiaceae bacterium]|nr:cysteine hydrolase [Burkholderiaceae bacterium]
MTRKVQLLLIDPQNDFCDLPPARCPADPGTGQRLAPALPV